MSAGASASEAMEEVPETSRNETPWTIVLKSSDGQEFEVDLVMAKQSGMIKKMIDVGCVERSVPFDGPVLAKVLEYWKQHASGKEDGDLKEWDKEFVKGPKEEMLQVIIAARYLDTGPLLDLCCQAVADTIERELQLLGFLRPSKTTMDSASQERGHDNEGGRITGPIE